MSDVSLRVAPYLRVSTADQFPNQQLGEAQKYWEARGWRLGGIYEEPKGTKGQWEIGQRQALSQLIDDAKSSERKFDVVLIYKLDRLTRAGPGMAHALLATLQKNGIALVSVTEKWLDTTEDNGPMGKLVMNLLVSLFATMAEMEPIQISERVTASRNAIRAGLRPGKLGGTPRKLDEQAYLKLLEVKATEPDLLWRDIAVRLKLKEGTCRRGFWEARKMLQAGTLELPPGHPWRDRGLTQVEKGEGVGDRGPEQLTRGPTEPSKST